MCTPGYPLSGELTGSTSRRYLGAITAHSATTQLPTAETCVGSLSLTAEMS